MRYVFDTNALSTVLRFYYRDRFPSFWARFDGFIEAGRILSVREVRREIERYHGDQHLLAWVKQNASLFGVPTRQEMEFVRTIFAIPRFRAVISKQALLQGHPVADPFVVARAKVFEATVVTMESWKPNAAKIPNICQHFGVACTDLEGFMATEGWSF